MDTKIFDLIKKLEGFKLNAYRCPAGVWTIGYGTTFLFSKNRPVRMGDVITQKEADEELEKFCEDNLEPFIDSIKEYYGKDQKFPLELEESLYSLGYNRPVALCSKTLKDAIKAKDKEAISNYFMKFTKVKGVENQGLVNRRKNEVNNFKEIWK